MTLTDRHEVTPSIHGKLGSVSFHRVTEAASANGNVPECKIQQRVAVPDSRCRRSHLCARGHGAHAATKGKITGF